MEKNVLKVRMLGTFSLEYKGKELVLDRNKTSKTTQLFQLLMFHTEDGGISKAAMIDALYGRVEVENKNGSLNNTIFRLRKQLKDIGLPDSKYINIQSGMCCWDGNIEVQVDVNEFRKLRFTFRKLKFSSLTILRLKVIEADCENVFFKLGFPVEIFNWSLTSRMSCSCSALGESVFPL